MDLSESTDLEPTERAHNLTPQQEAFVSYAIQGIPQGKAAELAGFSHPDKNGYRLMQLPHIIAAIAHGACLQIEAKLVPASINCLYEIITNPKAPASARVAAANAALDRSRYAVKQKEQPKGLSDKSISEMNLGELDAIISLLKTRKSADGAEDAQIIEGSTVVHQSNQ